AVVGGRPEVAEVVLVVGLVLTADHRDGCRREVLRVRGRGVVLERLVVRVVIQLRGASDVQVRAGADRGEVVGASTAGPVPRTRESALEPAPGGAGPIEQIPDVGATELDRLVHGVLVLLRTRA